MRILVAAFIALLAGSAMAQDHQYEHPPYAGMQNRDVKVLTDQQVANLRTGRGMGSVYLVNAHQLMCAVPLATAGADRDSNRTVEELERELAEAHRRVAATAEILKVISTSPNDLQQVMARRGTIARPPQNPCGPPLPALSE